MLLDNFIQNNVIIDGTAPTKRQYYFLFHPEAKESEFKKRDKRRYPGRWKFWNDSLDDFLLLVVPGKTTRKQLFHLSARHREERTGAEIVQSQQYITLSSAVYMVVVIPIAMPYIDHGHIESRASFLVLNQPNRIDVRWIDHAASRASC
uniref:Uncharacterized protein n=1 Tax=Pseudomonas fluorescens TaxID=294 RepID=A0A5E6X5F2_PSEFL|nr:hypothetical protein PS652_05120 [Pseudomonas fluorescens]